MNWPPPERRPSSAESHGVAELLRRLLARCERDTSLDLWLPFPQNACSFGFGRPPRPLPIGALFILWAEGPPFKQPCAECGDELRMVSFGGLLTVGGGRMICSACDAEFFQRALGGLGTVGQIVNATKLGQTAFAPSTMVFGGPIGSDGAALLAELKIPRLHILNFRQRAT